MRQLEAIMASAEDRGHALWLAVLEAARVFPNQTDVMTVGEAGGEIVVLRVHTVDPSVFTNLDDDEGYR